MECYCLTYISWDLFPSDSKAHHNIDAHSRLTVVSTLGNGVVQAVRQQHDSVHFHHWTCPEKSELLG